MLSYYFHFINFLYYYLEFWRNDLFEVNSIYVQILLLFFHFILFWNFFHINTTLHFLCSRYLWVNYHYSFFHSYNNVFAWIASIGDLTQSVEPKTDNIVTPLLLINKVFISPLELYIDFFLGGQKDVILFPLFMLRRLLQLMRLPLSIFGHEWSTKVELSIRAYDCAE